MNEYYKPAEDLNFVVLSVLAERALFDKARSGDESAKESIIRNHLLLAAKEGRRWARGLLPEDEVISAANFALMKAYEAFDHNRGNRFASFLRPFIRGAWRSYGAPKTRWGSIDGSSPTKTNSNRPANYRSRWSIRRWNARTTLSSRKKCWRMRRTPC